MLTKSRALSTPPLSNRCECLRRASSVSENKTIMRSDSRSDRRIDGDAEHLAKAREHVARSVAAATADLVDVDVKVVVVLSFLYFVKTSAIGDFDATRFRGRGFNISVVEVR